ncbi:SPFH domain-containing protein [Lentimicrobium sp.]|jgi:regulator of protease activity HflC (stomatin/prohibitin superfamily)|uniref:SPFH domain-containing protein n=1 Tax=Lentimicrobium sp. TaxID=2034841 RepID=UPI0025F8BFC8|nr:SPFH domain-containing protein [Lentimicrobium sp.]MCO5257937.1 SPFH domain-containing protein [Lentimicrobium sp.]MCO5264080.1 SPFH domain-containing protein [Lentimicrobium sp.]HPF63598.1 SPFH domain-containing protein [Lentimicrobium sp.]HPJ62170.1 SPFH domain-containing protein [Lentimicrobium sp.]HPR26542.1 SPFH domain-containing protein [Lentimicrobium sp.]
MDTKEKFARPMSGYVMLVVVIAMIAFFIYNVVNHAGLVWLMVVSAVILALALVLMPGFLVVNPNESSVLVLFGDYIGTVKHNGFFWVNPFYTKKKISLRARNLNSDPIKVNDKIGNPIMIGIVLVWRAQDTFKAAFEVDDYIHYVEIQSEAAIRKLAGHYPYDNFDDEQSEITLRSGGEEVNHVLEQELSERLERAGIEVIEARISYLAYSSEIAGAMLRRQQASAIIAARVKIVEGAVSMVEMALAQLSEKKLVDLDEEKKAAMVSNLMVVLCSDKDASPVINTGTLHQ